MVVPFRGDEGAARALLAALGRLSTRVGDEVIVVDNTDDGVIGPIAPTSVVVVTATVERSSYHARNVGAERARTPWLLFIDADCRPPATLLDDYFTDPGVAAAGIVAGNVVGAGGQRSLIARWARSRSMLGVAYHLERGPHPAGVTANLLVRRDVWDGLGGFKEGVRSGADLDFCWRAQQLGWSLRFEPRAVVEHEHPERLVPMLRKAIRYGPGQRWLDRVHPGSSPRPSLVARLTRDLGAAIVLGLTLRFERAAFKLVDACWFVAFCAAYVWGDNRAERNVPAAAVAADRRLAVFLDAFPARSETFIAGELRALRSLGWGLRIESGARPPILDLRAGREHPTIWLEDESKPEKVVAVVLLFARHPVRVLRDVRDRRRWSRTGHTFSLPALAPAARRIARHGERHVHVHFGAYAALNALRICRILGLTYSLELHGYDIFQRPHALEEKLTGASFATATCDYSVRHLRSLVPADVGGRIGKVIMGVDGERFRRRRPPPDSGVVVALGRYLEKKGFAHLIDAAAMLRDSPSVSRVVIAGDGPLREPLEEQVRALGLDGFVLLPRAWGEAVLELLEDADLFAAPCVVAADGDRDSMPVVVKEALAMELPVVGSDEVGIPEMVKPAWGRLVPPRDPGALAAAVDELLSRPASERAAMGRAGREFVLEACNVDRETQRLARMLTPWVQDRG